MKKEKFLIGILISMTIGFSLNFIQNKAFAEDIEDGDGRGKIICYSGAYYIPNMAYIDCHTCSVRLGAIDPLSKGQCNP